jgi:ADP-ribose pyrophosphatase YjhB (NUDIX family)
MSGCGYHALGKAAHLPPDARTLAVPVFVTETKSYGTETAMTQAVIREFATRTRMRVTPEESTQPFTYNSSTQQSSSFVITVVASVSLTTRDGRVLYQNDNYVFRQQYQSTTDLATFLQEDPAAIQRLSRDFARQLVADVLEGM